MDAITYLTQLQIISELIEQMENEKTVLYSLATKVTTNMSMTGGGGNGDTDKIGKIIAKIDELTSRINDKIDYYIDLRCKIIDEIYKLDQFKHRVVLYKRYVQFKSWDMVALEMNLAYSTVCNLHTQAIKDFNKILLNSKQK